MALVGKCQEHGGSAFGKHASGVSVRFFAFFEVTHRCGVTAIEPVAKLGVGFRIFGRNEPYRVKTMDFGELLNLFSCNFRQEHRSSFRLACQEWIPMG